RGPTRRPSKDHSGRYALRVPSGTDPQVFSIAREGADDGADPIDHKDLDYDDDPEDDQDAPVLAGYSEEPPF
ncbi:hypothetical protein ACH4E7_45460, partial [Kitasatospora sp. NPDC018058]|uniref:hypothetical protein n=1 Tax=Kitasatospora sp. NPDC018058 TaxID=3364025 RepID=UPI0037C1A235